MMVKLHARKVILLYHNRFTHTLHFVLEPIDKTFFVAAPHSLNPDWNSLTPSITLTLPKLFKEHNACSTASRHKATGRLETILISLILTKRGPE